MTQRMLGLCGACVTAALALAQPPHADGPLALAAVSGGHQDSARASGQLYAANTLGAILGALGTSFWLIPDFGTHRSAQVLVLCATASAAVLAYADGARGGGSAPARSLFALACGVLAAGVVPGMPVKFLAHGRHIWSITHGDTYPYVSEGAASTVAVHVAPDGYRHFHVSGRVEASNNPDDLRLERMLGHLSALAHPQPESVLVVGLGAGVTAGALGVHPEIKRIVICEIEPRVTGATRQFARENYAILDDPRVELVFDDARHFLATTRERFDVITSDPIHPWVRGNSMLFSRQYYAIVREHLRPGGIATQWVPLYDTNAEAIRIQMRTFSEAFVQASIWNSAVSGGGYDVVLLGRTETSRLSIPAMQARIDANPKLAASLREVHIGSALELLATYAASGADMPHFTAGAQINDDFSLKLEYISGLALNQQHADQIYAQMVGARTSPTGLFEGPEAPELLQRIAAKR
jgi:spermidine synthase